MCQQTLQTYAELIDQVKRSHELAVATSLDRNVGDIRPLRGGNPSLPDDLPRVLMYHMISPQGTFEKHRGLRVDPTMFERQIAWLASNGWEFVTLSTLTRGGFRGGKQVAITFDDGYEDNALNALPVLQKYGAKATLYLVVD